MQYKLATNMQIIQDKIATTENELTCLNQRIEREQAINPQTRYNEEIIRIYQEHKVTVQEILDNERSSLTALIQLISLIYHSQSPSNNNINMNIFNQVIFTPSPIYIFSPFSPFSPSLSDSEQLQMPQIANINTNINTPSFSKCPSPITPSPSNYGQIIDIQHKRPKKLLFPKMNDNAESEIEIKKQNKSATQRINDALSQYHYDDGDKNKSGSFLKWCDEKGFDHNLIEDELLNNTKYTDIDDFTFNLENLEMFKVLQHCYKYGDRKKKEGATIIYQEECDNTFEYKLHLVLFCINTSISSNFDIHHIIDCHSLFNMPTITMFKLIGLLLYLFLTNLSRICCVFEQS